MTRNKCKAVDYSANGHAAAHSDVDSILGHGHHRNRGSALSEKSSPANYTNWDDVRLQRVAWLMIDRLPCRELTIIEGPGGLGKTTVMIDIAARLSTGREMPDGTPCDGPGDIILIADEDRAEVLKARLLAAGADMARIHHLTGFGERDDRFSMPSHGKDLLAAVQDCDARMVIIDALFSHFDKGLKTSQTEDVRSAIVPLSVIAHTTGAVITATRHWGKTARGAAERGLGSIDITNVARSVLTVGRHPHDDNGPHIIAVAKSNLGNDYTRVPSLTFTLERTTVPAQQFGDDEVEIARVVWGDMVALTADDLAYSTPQSAEEKTQSGSCMERLYELLATGPQPVAKVKAALLKEKFSASTIDRAKKKAAIQTIMGSTFPATAEWCLPPVPSRARSQNAT